MTVGTLSPHGSAPEHDARGAEPGAGAAETAVVGTLAALLPVSYGLPALPRALWTVLSLLLLARVAFLRPVVAPERWYLAAAGYLALVAGVLAATTARNPTASMATGAQIAVFLVLGPLAARRLVATPARRRTLVAGFLVGQTLSALVAGLQAVAPSELVGELLFGRASGLAGHPNILGLMSVVAVLVLIGSLAMLPRVAGLLLIAVNAAALLLSGSLTALIALVVGIIVYALVQQVSLIKVVGGAVAGAMGVAVLSASSTALGFVSPTERVLQTTGQTEKIGTLEQRARSVEYAWTRIRAEWFFGVGLDNGSGGTFDGATVTHSVLVRAWFQGGIALLLAFLLLYLVAVRAVGGAVARGRGATGAAVTSALLSFALTSASFEQAYFWGVLLCALAVCLIDAAPPVTTPPALSLPGAASVEGRPTPRARREGGRPCSLGG